VIFLFSSEQKRLPPGGFLFFYRHPSLILRAYCPVLRGGFCARESCGSRLRPSGNTKSRLGRFRRLGREKGDQMANFLKLTNAVGGVPIYVNMDLVTSMQSKDSPTSHTTVLVFDRENTLVVGQDVDQLLKDMKAVGIRISSK
jgi:hypothetical protein